MLGSLLLLVLNSYYSEAVYVVLGNNAKLTCPFTASGWSKYTSRAWIQLENDEKYDNVNTSEITIRNIEVTDSREYLCDGPSEHSIIFLYVIVYAAEGSTIVWKCPFMGPLYEWQKYTGNNWEMLSNNDRYSKASLSQITIQNVDVTDSGQYRCNVNGIPSNQIVLNVTEPQTSASIEGPVAGGVSGGIAVLALIAAVLYIYTKRNWTNSTQNHDYEKRDNAKAEIHLYEETQSPNSNERKLPAYITTSEALMSSPNDIGETITMYGVRDFMRVLQDESSLSRHINKEYAVLNSMPILSKACDDEMIDIKTSANTVENYTQNALIKKHDDKTGYIITTVPDQSDIDNFWTMITNYQVGYIALLLQEMEKISEFFPNTLEPITTQRFIVETRSFEKLENNIFKFVLDISNKEKKTVMQVKLYKTTDWKAGEIHPPIDTMSKLLDMISGKEPGMVALVGNNGIGFPVCANLGACQEEEYILCYDVIRHFLQNEHAYAEISETTV